MLGGTSRKVLYLDNMVGASAALVDSMRAERGDLMAVQAPVALVVFDVLHAIGMPEDAICIIMGNVLYEQVNEYAAPTDKRLTCEFCDQTAAMVLPYPDGYRIACGDHAFEIVMAGTKQMIHESYVNA